MLQEEHAELVYCGKFGEVLGVGAGGFEDKEGFFLKAVVGRLATERGFRNIVSDEAVKVTCLEEAGRQRV